MHRLCTRELHKHPGKKYDLRLADLQVSNQRGIEVDITDLSSCREACQGVNTVIHLAGIACPDSTFEETLHTNIVGTYNIFEAAFQAKVRRVVYASSAQVAEGYPLDTQVNTDMPVRPKNIYGVSKAYGEAVADYYAYQRNVEAIAVRIGAFYDPDAWTHLDSRDLSAWANPEDLCSLLINCVEADLTAEPFVIAHGISNNRFKRLDLSDTKRLLGYAPKADSFSHWNVPFHNNSQPKA